MDKVNSNKSRKVVGIILSILIVIILAYIGTVVITSRTVNKISKDASDFNFAGTIGLGKSEFEEFKRVITYEFDSEGNPWYDLKGEKTVEVPKEMMEKSETFDVYTVRSKNGELYKLHSNLTPKDGKLVFKGGTPADWTKYVVAYTPPPLTPEEREQAIKDAAKQRADEVSGAVIPGESKNNSKEQNSGSERTGDFWSDAGSWFNDAQNENKEAGLPVEAQNIIKIFADMINVIGTSIIALVTIFLGIKYMYGSVDAKVSVKESLPDLLVACVFFFGWSSIRTLLMPNDVLVFMGTPGESYQSLVARIFGIGMYIANFLVVAAVVYVGVRYIFSGAEGRAELKVKSPQFMLGIIMAFAASTFLTFVSSVVNQVFGG